MATMKITLIKKKREKKISFDQLKADRKKEEKIK